MAIDEEARKKFLEGIVFNHRIEAVCKTFPSMYRFYDTINGWHNVWFEDLDDGTRIMRSEERCKCRCS